MNKTLLTASSLALLSCAAWAAATQWQTEPKQSTLEFVGKQAGAETTCAFEKFTADIQFDPKDLASSRFSVDIDVKSVNSKDKERDDTLRGADWFATDKFATAHYLADRFTDKGGGKFVGHGKLTIRDVTRDVPIEFTFKSDDAGAWLKGGAQLKRLDFGVGQGEWKDTSWVPNAVRVQFNLKLER